MRSITLAVIALAAAFSAQAHQHHVSNWGEATPAFSHESHGKAKTRAEVLAELQAARASGELARLHSEAGFQVESKSTKTRAQVQAEYQEYVKSGKAAKDAALYIGG